MTDDAAVTPDAGPWPDQVDAESKVAERPEAHKTELRLWLRMLTCANLVEVEIRQRLRERFATTLPRFDLMAQLERSDRGLLMSELSRRMMVSNGNITGLVSRLAEAGLVERNAEESDRRAVRVRLTEEGRRAFELMAAEHAKWIGELFGGVPESEQKALLGALGHLKGSILTGIDRRGSDTE